MPQFASLATRNKLYDQLHQTKWKFYKEYGGELNRRGDAWIIAPCHRITYPKHQEPNTMVTNNGTKIKWPGDNLFAYHASWIIANHRTPRDSFFNEGKITLSHICGQPKQTKYSACIEVTHMNEEPIQINLARKNCHRLIRKWVKHMIIPHGFHNFTPEFGGPIYTTHIPMKEKYTVLTKYMHIGKEKAEALKRGNCGHHPNCFINYG